SGCGSPGCAAPMQDLTIASAAPMMYIARSRPDSVMTPAARLQATIDLIGAIRASQRPADGVVSGWLRHRRFIGSKDRADITGRLYAWLRHEARLGWWIARCGAEDTPRMRAVAAIMLLDQQPVESV